MPPKAKLEDVLAYTPESYFSDDELSLIRSIFNGAQGNRVIKVLRKAFLPTISDPELPIEEVGKDSLMAGLDIVSMPADHLKAIMQGRQEAIKFIIGGFIHLKQIANVKDESPAERAARRAQDSAK